jgi:DNA-binding NtrC family response regulator
MSKLWIVHRSPQARAALLRATGLDPAWTSSGAPSSADFPVDEVPDAIVLVLPRDFERELEFALDVGPRVREPRWILVGDASQRDEIRRVFQAGDVVLLDHPPDPRALRSAISAALSRRKLPSVADRRLEARTTERFEAWLGVASVPGLARALDPAFAALPLLLRGRPGSGRSLAGLHAERVRGGRGGLLRIDAREIADIEALAARLESTRARTGTSIRTVWLDEIDALSRTAQRALAEWIRHETPPGVAGDPGPLRWIATAGPAGLEDRLEAVLAQAFSPLVVEVPPIDPQGGEIAHIAAATARAFARQIGAPARRFAPSALEALAAEPWWGERAELDAVLRTTLACAAHDPIEAADLRFPDARAADRPIPSTTHGSATAASERDEHALALDDEPIASLLESAFPSALPIDPSGDPSSELARLAERWPGESPTPTPPLPGTPTPRPSAPPASAAKPSDDLAWRKLARSLSHEIRNPLVSIRTFTELLPEHHADETFRARFKELVGKDVAHIQDVVTRLAKAAARDRMASEPVDVSALIERLLADRRDAIGRNRLVVLSELERTTPLALADADALEIALAGLIDRALDSLPERGDLFLATHRIERAGDGRPRLRVLLRHHDPRAEGMGGELDPVHHILEYVLAETIVSALGGRLTIDPTQGPETLIVIDLPTPEPGSAAA